MLHQSQFIEDYYNRYESTNLGDHISVIRGVSYKPTDIREPSDNAVAILRSNNISDGEINFDDLVYVSQTCVSEKQLLSTGDIVMCGSNGSKKLVGKAGLMVNDQINTSFGAFCLGIRCIETLAPEYLNAYFNSRMYRSIIEELGNGTNIINIRPDHITSLSIPIPEKDVQSEFVAISRQADKSKFDGFKSQFISQFGNDSILKVELSSLCTEFLDGDWIESKDQSDSGYRLVQTGNVGVGEYIDKSGKARFVSEDTFIRLNCTEIFAGDILFSRLPEPLGRCCILPENFPKAITAVDCTIARLGDRCLPEFLVTYTSTELYTSQVNKCMTGTTRQRISRNNLAKILVPCPDLAAQNSFVMVARQADKSKYLN